jgi:hypothetical protein
MNDFSHSYFDEPDGPVDFSHLLRLYPFGDIHPLDLDNGFIECEEIYPDPPYSTIELLIPKWIGNQIIAAREKISFW